MGDRGAAGLGPAPIDARVQSVGEVANLALGRRVAVEVRRGRQHPAQQQGRVDGRELALPGACAGLLVEKVILEPLMPGRVGFGSLLAPPEEAQRGECAFCRIRAGDEPASTPTGYAVSPNPTAVMLAGQSAHVLSSTSPLARLVSCRK
jgi:hypothetical protein